MNKTVTFLSIAAVAVAAGGLLTLTFTNATDTTPIGMMSNGVHAFMGKGMHGFQGKFKEVKDAIEANDFAAFQAAVADTPFADKVTTPEQFAQVQQMHTLMQAGKKDEAKAIADALGLPLPGKGNHGNREAIKAAVDANDFAAFQKVVTEKPNSPLASIDTKDEFAKFVEMHGLLDQAKSIADELGIPMHEQGGRWGGMRDMKNKTDAGDNEAAFDDDADDVSDGASQEATSK